MTDVMTKHGYLVFSSDLVDRGHGFAIMDFLKSRMFGRMKNIVTNPPYGDDAETFAKHALSMLPDDGKLVLVCRYEWLCAKKRRYLFDKESAFCKLIVLNKRPRWIKGSKGSPRDKIQLNTAVRPTAQTGVERVDFEELKSIAEQLGKNAEVVLQ